MELTAPSLALTAWPQPPLPQSSGSADLTTVCGTASSQGSPHQSSMGGFSQQNTQGSHQSSMGALSQNTCMAADDTLTSDEEIKDFDDEDDPW